MNDRDNGNKPGSEISTSEISNLKPQTGSGGLSSGADFHSIIATCVAASWEDPCVITLPVSRARVKVRRPTCFYWNLRCTAWPRELVKKVDTQLVGVKPTFTDDEKCLLLWEQLVMVHAAFIEPKVSLDPGPDQFDTAWLHAADGQFLVSYLLGVVNEDGTPAKKDSPSAAPEPAHEDVPLPFHNPWRN